MALTKQTQNICIAFIQRRPNVFDVDPTLYKCHTNVLCLLDKLHVHLEEHVITDHTRMPTVQFN